MTPSFFSYALSLLVFVFAQVSLASTTPSFSFMAPPIYPEGIAYNAKTDEFYVSSMHLGRIGAVKKHGATGKYKIFADHKDLISVVGLYHDEPRHRLLACVSDPGVSVKTNPKTQKKIARLAVFSTKTKKLIKMHELDKLLPDANHFCNDIAVSPAGDIFVTDSFAPVIYKIDTHNKASIFLQDPQFAAEGFNLNGILYHPEGYLLVARYNEGTLWKVTLDSNPKATKIQLPGTYPGADGLVLLSASEIIMIQNIDANKAHKFQSTDNWQTATLVKSSEKLGSFPTTGIKNKQGVHVVDSQLDILFAGKASVKPLLFKIWNIGQLD